MISDVLFNLSTFWSELKKILKFIAYKISNYFCGNANYNRLLEYHANNCNLLICTIRGSSIIIFCLVAKSLIAL